MNRHIVFVAALAGGLALEGCVALEDRVGLVIADVTVISPERVSPLEHAYVRILNGRITEVSEHPLRGERALDGRGRYLVPGLIDGHVHLAVAPGFPAPMTAEQAATHPQLVAEALGQDPRSYLFFGFTTVIDLVGSADRTAQWNALEWRPDAHFCGAVAIVDAQIRSVPFPYFSYGVPQDKQILPIRNPADHTSEAVIARMAADGAVCVKTIYEQGITPTIEQARELVAAAHAHDLPVLIHANRKRGQAFALAAGVDMIVHGMWRDQNEPVELDAEAREVLSGIARAGIGYQPTTQVIAGLLDMTQSDYLGRADLLDAYPSALVDWYVRNENVVASTRLRTAGAAVQARLQGTIARATAVTRVLNDADGRLLFGSDTPSDLIYTNPPGLNGRLEMNHWIAADVSEEKLFHAMTIGNATMFNLQGEIGTVEAGKVANLLLLRSNPLDSVSAYDTIETVLLHGSPVARSALSARAAR